MGGAIWFVIHRESRTCKAEAILEPRRRAYYVGSMKRKTSVTLAEDVLQDLAGYAGSGESRSAYIERVLRRHFRRRARTAEQARDIERINAAADRLNAEMVEVLEVQASRGSRS